MSEVDYNNFDVSQLVFGEVNNFEFNTEDGKVKNSRIHLGYGEQKYIQLQMPVAVIRVDKDFKIKNGKTSAMMIFDNDETRKVQESLPIDDFYQYDKLLTVADEIVDSFVDHVMSDQNIMDNLKIQTTKIGSDRKPVQIKPSKIKKKLANTLKPSLYYIPDEEKS